MAADSGLIVWQYPSLGQTTDAGQAIVGVMTPGAPTDKVFFVAAFNITIVEVGCLIGTATGADTYIFTVSTAPNIGGAYTLRSTITGPTATIMAAGTCLRSRPLDIEMTKGMVLKFTVTDPAAAGTGCFYAYGYPSGDQALHRMVGDTQNEILSTT